MTWSSTEEVVKKKKEIITDNSAVTIFKPETQTNKLNLTLVNSSPLSKFCHLKNVTFVRLFSF